MEREAALQQKEDINLGALEEAENEAKFHQISRQRV
jgi:hypothetical protein